MSKFIVWEKPEGIAADNSENIIKRASVYRFNQKHYLKDGTRIIPKLKTVFSVLSAYDQFNIFIVIDSESYDLFVEVE